VSGSLDEQLVRARDWLEARPDFRDALSLRFADPTLTLPPTIRVTDLDRLTFALGAEASTRIRDGDANTLARIYGAVDLTMSAGPAGTFGIAVSRAHLALTCEPRTNVLTPCYSELVDVFRKRAADQEEKIAEQLAARVDDLVGSRDVPIDRFRAHIDHVVISTRPDAPSAWIRVDVFGGIYE
jgi:hypothetical protein